LLCALRTLFMPVGLPGVLFIVLEAVCRQTLADVAERLLPLCEAQTARFIFLYMYGIVRQIICMHLDSMELVSWSPCTG
jgi:hypothetical protein